MTPLVIELHQRSQRFHADIARRAAMVPQAVDHSYSIPNKPYGVPKVPPPVIVTHERNPEPAYWHCMWFFDLVQFHEPKAPGAPRVETIQKAVARNFGISKLDIISERRTADVVLPRQIAMYLAKKLTTRSLPEIGRRFGGKDHTTILHAVRKIAALVGSDADFAGRVLALESEICA